MIHFTECLPHLLVELGGVSTRTQHAGWLANHVLRLITADVAKGTVNLENTRLRIGDDHALQRLEGDGGDALLTLHLHTFGNVARHKHHGPLAIEAGIHAPCAGLEHALPYRSFQLVLQRLRLLAGQGSGDEIHEHLGLLHRHHIQQTLAEQPLTAIQQPVRLG